MILVMLHSQTFLLPWRKRSSSHEESIHSKYKAPLFSSEAGATLDQQTSAAASSAAFDSEVVNFHWRLCLQRLSLTYPKGTLDVALELEDNT